MQLCTQKQSSGGPVGQLASHDLALPTSLAPGGTGLYWVARRAAAKARRTPANRCFFESLMADSQIRGPSGSHPEFPDGSGPP